MEAQKKARLEAWQVRVLKLRKEADDLVNVYNKGDIESGMMEGLAIPLTENYVATLSAQAAFHTTVGRLFSNSIYEISSVMTRVLEYFTSLRLNAITTFILTTYGITAENQAVAFGIAFLLLLGSVIFSAFAKKMFLEPLGPDPKIYEDTIESIAVKNARNQNRQQKIDKEARGMINT